MSDRVEGFHRDFRLMLVLVGLLLSLGLMLVYSSSVLPGRASAFSSVFIRQVLFALLGILAGTVTMRLDYHLWGRLALPGILLAVALLILTLLFGREAYGAVRSLSVFGLFNFQTSEAAKVLLLLYSAHFLGRPTPSRETVGDYLPLALAWGSVAVLIMLQPDFSTLAVITFVLLVQLFLAGLPWRFFLLMITVGSMLGALLVSIQHYRWLRVVHYAENLFRLKPVDDYQLWQSLIALGRGGLAGQGVGQSLQKLYYLPFPHNDFIFAVAGEELGFLGVAFLVFLYLGFMFLGGRIIRNAPDPFGRLLAAGIVFTVVFYAFFHMGVVSGLVPSTGLPLPFVSAGGTNLVVLLTGVGVLLNIHLQSAERLAGRRRR